MTNYFRILVLVALCVILSAPLVQRAHARKHGFGKLRNDLEGLYWAIPYEEGVFDCSEMCAYLEIYLERGGWDTIIVVGWYLDPDNTLRSHAWLAVEVYPDVRVIVEVTNLSIVPYYDFYRYIPRYYFESAAQAREWNNDEFVYPERYPWEPLGGRRWD